MTHSAVLERSWKATILGTKITARVVQPQRPTGLAGVCWTQQDEDVNITVAGHKFTRVGSIMWTQIAGYVPSYGWSLGEETGFWLSCNTLGYKGKRWTFKHPDAAFRNLCEYVRSSIAGGPRDWK